MMDLVLWRHAEAHDLGEQPDEQADLARELTPRGFKQATRIAAWLDRQLPENTKILTSPSVRTDQTARALQRKYKSRIELLPSAGYAELLTVAQWPTCEATVLLVGHQPGLGAVVAHVLGIETKHCAVKKGAVWWLRTRERAGQLETVLVTVQTPEYL
jgi:phosphohistidine phosphatase